MNSKRFSLNASHVVPQYSLDSQMLFKKSRIIFLSINYNTGCFNRVCSLFFNLVIEHCMGIYTKLSDTVGKS